MAFTPTAGVCSPVVALPLRLWTWLPARSDPRPATSPVWGRCVAPDGNTLLSWGADDTVRQWRTISGKEQRGLPVAGGVDPGARFWPDGKSLLVIKDKTLQR